MNQPETPDETPTPRPWEMDDELIIGPNDETIAEYKWPEDGAFIVRSANAFDALLAVARATVKLSETALMPHASEIAMADLDAALDALDTAHPGWREWTP